MLQSSEAILENTSSQGIGAGFKLPQLKQAKLENPRYSHNYQPCLLLHLTLQSILAVSKQLFTQAHCHLALETLLCCTRNPSYADMERIISASLTFTGTTSE